MDADYSRRRKKIDPNLLIADTISIVKRVIGERIQFVFSPSATESVNVDPDDLQQIIINLFLNTRAATPNGRRLVLETSDVVLDCTYSDKHFMVSPGKYVLVVVSDMGARMMAALESCVLEPFFTDKPRRKSANLGLTMVYGIVKRNDGFIWGYSESGEGSCFKLYLRACELEGPCQKADSHESHDRILQNPIALTEMDRNVGDALSLPEEHRRSRSREIQREWNEDNGCGR